MAKARKDHVRKGGNPRQKHVYARELQSAAPFVAATSLQPQPIDHHIQSQSLLIKATNLTSRHTLRSQKLARIRSCLQTVAALLETNPAYLPVFLRLEQELETEQLKQDAIARSKTYLKISS